MNFAHPHLVVLFACFMPLVASCASLETSPADGDARMITSAALGPNGSLIVGGVFGECLPHPVALDISGAADCFAIQLRATTGACTCDPAQHLVPVAAEHAAALGEAMARAQASAPVDWNCACEAPQIFDDAGDVEACENEAPLTSDGADGQPLGGFCYVDPTLAPARGSGAVAKNCPVDARHFIRFAGAWAQEEPVWKSLFLSCGGAAGN
jgi:hypothetical protein